VNLEFGIEVWHFIGAGLVGLCVGGVLVLTRLPDSALSRPLRRFAIAAALWGFGDVVATLATDMFWKQIGITVLYTGLIFVPPLWWTLAVRSAEDRDVRLPFDADRWTTVPLVLASVMWLAMLTNPWHGEFIVPVVGGRNVYGPLWWVMAIPSYSQIFGVFALELWILGRSRTRGIRRHAAFMVAASGVTLVANLIYVIGATPSFNATLPSLAVAGGILTIGMIREGLFGVLPLALPIIASHDPDGILVVRPGGRILYANRRVRELLSPVDLTADTPWLASVSSRLRGPNGGRVSESEPKDAMRYRSDWEKHWWQSVLRPTGALFCYGDDDARWFRITAQEVHGRGQRLLAYSVRIHDDTDEQRAEVEVRRARRLESVAQLSRGVAHDFNNLLTVVRGNADLLAEDLPEEPELQRKIQQIVGAGEQAMELAHQLQLYAGATEPVRTIVDLSGLVRDMSEVLDSVLHPEPGGVKPVVELDLTSYPVVVEVDATQLRQLVLNLLVNARDAIDGRAGEIHIQTGSLSLVPENTERLVAGRDSAPGDYGYVRVTDTGCGMDSATQERIFEPFFSTKGKSRGIGLSTVFGIVRSHDALLELDSAPGRGTCFCVYFPISESGPQLS
jgi:signal transduction histidine kinase